MRPLVLAVLFAASLCVPPSAWAQATTTSTVLKVSGDVSTPLSLSAADLKTLTRTRVTVKAEAGDLVFEGVLVADLLKRAGVPLGGDLRGAAIATFVVASAADGYQAVFSIGELDPALTSNEIIVADTLDGKPLAAAQGPFRLVTPKDSRPVRGVRMLERLDVVRLKK